MVENLKQFLAAHPAQGFKSVPHYFASGDFVTYYFRNGRCYAERVDDFLTVFLTHETAELVGFKIKGVKHILETAGDFGVIVDDGEVKLGLFFFLGATMAKDEAQKRRYEELEPFKDAILNRRELQPA